VNRLDAERFVKDTLREIEFARGGDAIEQTYRIADQHVVIGFRSPKLFELLSPSIAHLRSDPSPRPDLRLTVADPAYVHATIPALPWAPDRYRACGEVGGYVEGQHYSHLNLPMSALSVFDETEGRAGYWCRKPEDLPSYELSAPFRALFTRFFTRSRMMPILHAACVARGDKAVLIIGGKGAGKSTTTLSCLSVGMGFLGDDKIVVDPTNLRAHSLYCPAKFFLADSEKLGLGNIDGFLRLPRTADDRKALLYVDRFSPGQMVAQARIVAILECNLVPGEQSTVIKSGPGSALQLLASDNVGMFPSSAAATLANVAQLCRRVPCYRLNAGHDRKEVARTVARFVENC